MYACTCEAFLATPTHKKPWRQGKTAPTIMQMEKKKRRVKERE